MGYIENNLIPGEQVLFKTRLHSITIFVHATMGLIIGLIGLFCLYNSIAGQNDPTGQSKVWEISGGILVLIGTVTVIYAILKRNATEMAVTNRRILIKTGFLSRRTIELLLSRVESILITEPFLGRVLGYGTVVVRGTGGTPESFDCIAKPKEFRRCVQEQIEATQGQTRTASAL
jgi:uncharacterized membrane protein YdbT with pleckstrin-like domain